MSPDEMREDPDHKQYLLLKEQLEFWQQRTCDESLSPEEKDHAEVKYLEIMGKCTEVLQRFNERWEEIEGPIPEPDEYTLKFIRNKLADAGMEVTLDEIKEALEEE
jgi:hypothetical protein